MFKLLLGITLLNTFVLNHVQCCNEAVCGSVVSKCLLTQSCKCESEEPLCYKECYSCLGILYSECCSCVGMCPNQVDDTEGTPLSKKSHVEEFTEKVDDLFRVLTQYPDPLERWSSVTYPIDLDATFFASKKEMKLRLQNAEQEIVVPKKLSANSLNCTVAFMANCMSWTKCRNSCQSMGSASYRWFHDGCCECVGHTCINYGINESRCKKCLLNSEYMEEDYSNEEDEEMDLDD